MSNTTLPMAAKRTHDGSEKRSRVSPFMPMFEVFRDELDHHHDRRERTIKASRDITANSKKIIFALQRARSLKTILPSNIATETSERAATINKLFLSVCPDLAGSNAWRYQRQISGGIQEHMEAISFDHYLRHQTLITPDEAQKLLPDGILLHSDDYVLGLFDLVGELMRFAITTMATTGKLPSSADAGGGERTILQDLRILRTHFEALDTSRCSVYGLGKDVEKKMGVMKTCVEKVEVAVYGMMIRGRERPKGWIPDMVYDRADVESY